MRAMASTGVLLVFCTFPSRGKARQIGTLLVEKQLAACVNLSAEVTSIYRWRGEVCEESEVQGVFKVIEGRYEEFAAHLEELHPYEVPEIVAVPVLAGSEKYLKWVRQNA